MSSAKSTLYPPLAPFAVQQVPVGGRHVLQLEQCGSPHGFPAFFLHGGPGSQTHPLHRQFFDPSFYHIVLFDQRGCGRSAPAGCTDENTTAHLVEDIETLRLRLGFDRVMLFGGSWGATLALAYAAIHPRRIAAMVLRGIFLASREEVDWYLWGVARQVPEAWDALTQGQGGDLVARYHALVNQTDVAAAQIAAQRWVEYEEAVMMLGAAERGAKAAQDPAAVLARARIQLHYLAHDCFLAPDALLAGVGCLNDIPVLIVQGERDQVCPPGAAHELAARLPKAELRLVAEGGHSASEPAMAQALRQAADDLRGRL